jgi:hypothetical protein
MLLKLRVPREGGPAEAAPEDDRLAATVRDGLTVVADGTDFVFLRGVEDVFVALQRDPRLEDGATHVTGILWHRVRSTSLGLSLVEYPSARRENSAGDRCSRGKAEGRGSRSAA